MKRIIIGLIFCVWAIPGFSQSISISGTVYDKSGAVVPYVNIGIKKQKTGTISNKEGHFKLEVSNSLRKELLTFSCVGFEDRSIPVLSFTNNTHIEVVLSNQVIELSQVTISNKKRKISKIGITGRTPFIVIPAESYNSYDILEQAKLIQIRKPSRVLNANIYLESGLSDSVNIRLNFYNVENSLPGKRAIEKNIIRKFILRKGWLSFDLTKEDIYIDNNFIVAFEYLPNENVMKKRLLFGAKAGAKNSYFRQGSQGTWHKNQPGGATIYITVES